MLVKLILLHVQVSWCCWQAQCQLQHSSALPQDLAARGILAPCARPHLMAPLAQPSTCLTPTTAAAHTMCAPLSQLLQYYCSSDAWHTMSLHTHHWNADTAHVRRRAQPLAAQRRAPCHQSGIAAPHCRSSQSCPVNAPMLLQPATPTCPQDSRRKEGIACRCNPCPAGTVNSYCPGSPGCGKTTTVSPSPPPPLPASPPPPAAPVCTSSGAMCSADPCTVCSSTPHGNSGAGLNIPDYGNSCRTYYVRPAMLMSAQRSAGFTRNTGPDLLCSAQLCQQLRC